MSVLVVAAPDAELDELSVNDVIQTENVIVSRWRQVSGDVRHEMRERFDEILRPFGYETSLVVIRSANSLALFFTCMTLSALMRLRHQWCTWQLRDIVQKLFTFLSDNTRPDGRPRPVLVKRLTWPLTDYERCLTFFSSLQGMGVNVVNTIHHVSWITEVKLLKLIVWDGKFSPFRECQLKRALQFGMCQVE